MYIDKKLHILLDALWDHIADRFYYLTVLCEPLFLMNSISN